MFKFTSAGFSSVELSLLRLFLSLLKELGGGFHRAFGTSFYHTREKVWKLL